MPGQDNSVCADAASEAEISVSFTLIFKGRLLFASPRVRLHPMRANRRTLT
jgi:hypothetical protein